MNLVDQLLRVALLGSTWVLYLLLALSVVSIAAIVERFWFFRRNAEFGEGLRNKLSHALRADDVEEVDKVLAARTSVEGRVLAEAWKWRAGGRAAVLDVVESELGRAREGLERSMNLLGTLGNNAPFIGLFGTVLGVIEAFHHLGAGQGSAAMGNVMAGISEALIATGVGIFVAIPAVVAFNTAQKRIGDVETSVHSLAKLLTAWIETREKAGLPLGPPRESSEDSVSTGARASEREDAEPSGVVAREAAE